jgi:hypothetical protein
VRSSALLVLLAGCDVVAGVEIERAPCDAGTFAGIPTSDVVAATGFSLSWDRDLLVYSDDRAVFQQRLPGGDPTPIDLGIYDVGELALAPEGDALFFTQQIEPPIVAAALRDGTSWTFDGVAPAGSFAGTPSSPEFGPRRVLVRLAMGGAVQEYEQDGNTWVPVGPTQTVDSAIAPNLTPSGLDMVFASHDGVLVAHRASVGDWFGEPLLILPGEHQFPQLLDRCRELYTLDDLVVRRYAR